MTIKDFARNKFLGIDEIPSEILGAIGKEGLNELFGLVSYMYETGERPSQFRKNIIILISKKMGTDQCKNCRTISLISHSFKILTRNYNQGLVENELGEGQFGFRRDMGTREAILTLRLTWRVGLEKIFLFSWDLQI